MTPKHRAQRDEPRSASPPAEEKPRRKPADPKPAENPAQRAKPAANEETE